MTVFTEGELDYLASQRLGRLATVDAAGRVQNNPTAFFVNPDGTVDIGGHAMGGTKKFRNVREHPEAAFVVDDIVSPDTWQVRGIEIRGRAEALTGQPPPAPGFSAEIIRIHPRRIISWGIDGPMTSREAGRPHDVA
ncbi:pyridoxamine 5'-phosphate oxidase family protein [Thermocatellispora tengchongensis]|uniref:Pyridoxamine 5'-phosphate oxidase family protein n=1 Tax=Thermocatellispora tengchongensis TaxID=1073253 RepID=A0A840P1K0_9ACTN|nr:PPOX class F420-dependent oxidoreductase [Thermocatellispora tengchongensis]MBB5132859.1 pyridoxamine 5'-phosphate oxidase family protein [Thermocatellispora tengchongensis]